MKPKYISDGDLIKIVKAVMPFYDIVYDGDKINCAKVGRIIKKDWLEFLMWKNNKKNIGKELV